MNQLANFRKSLSLSQKEMANKIGVSISSYTKIESDHRSPSFNFIKKIKLNFPEFNTNIFFENK